MTRVALFDREEVAGIRGLTALTEPTDDRVGAIVDVAVIGARGDGKTQLIVHAIRTLRAYAPALSGAEHQYNRDVMQVVMNAREPRPDATTPGVVPHYVFRIRPEVLLEQVGGAERLRLLGRAAGLRGHAALAVGNAGLLGSALWALGHGVGAAVAAGLGAAALGGVAGNWLARRRFLGGGEIEIVFWDVAGEHVYSSSAADYYSFLGALVRERKARATSARPYAFAPALMCNPLALGTHADGSSFARLKQLLPLFASLDADAGRAMIAINRWSVVDEVCAPDTDREEIVALAPQARADDTVVDVRASDSAHAIQEALPVVKRDVVRVHCRDAEDGRDGDVELTYLRYDAGVQCEFKTRPWASWDELPAWLKARWRAPTSSHPAQIVDYFYTEGPGAFGGEARRTFLGWLAELAYRAPLARAEAERPRDAGASGDIVLLTQRAPAVATVAAAAGVAPAAVTVASPMQGPLPSLSRPAAGPDDDTVLAGSRTGPDVWSRHGGGGFGSGGT